MRSRNLIAFIGAALFGAIGLILTSGGALLLGLGGSPYYALTGIGLLLAAFLILRRNWLAAPLYSAIVMCTIIWAFFEVGPAPWQLMPRLVAPAILGLWFCLPPVRKSFNSGPARSMALESALCLFAPALLFVLSFGLIGATAYWGKFVASSVDIRPIATVDRDASTWSHYGNTIGGDRFSPAEQITPANVKNLKVAWTFRTGTKSSMFEGASIKVGDALFICTSDAVVRLDPDTGKQVWRYKPVLDIAAAPNRACRGVSYFAGRAGLKTCRVRLLWPTLDDHMHAIDAATGRPCADFGRNGIIDLREHMGPVTPGFHFTTSPPVILGDTAVFGALVYDNQSVDEPSGVVRGIDAYSGKLRWGWEGASPQSRKNIKPGDIFQRSTPNAWSVFSADPKLGLIYIPVGNSTPDYFGGQRTPGQERYSSSIVALDSATGDVRWSFQTVHHDLWDLDIPAQPVVADLRIKGVWRKALVASTKRGEIFVLDRTNGKPLYPVEERPVPQGAVQGERLSPTQPFPVNFPSFSPKHLREVDMWGATPIDQMLCRIRFKQRRYDGQFTPPQSGKGTIGFPDVFGVIGWGSVSVDPERQIMFVNASWLPYQARLIPRALADKGGLKPYDSKRPKSGPGAPSLHGDWLYAQEGTPYAVENKPFLSPLGYPCHAPPWGAIAAVDLSRGKLLWQRPFGTTRDAAPLGIPLPTGVFNMGGSLLTRSGLAFIGASIDNYLRAYDVRNGALLWEARLPAGGQANPMSYVSNKSGRQYIVMAAGGHSALQTKTGDYLIAYAL